MASTTKSGSSFMGSLSLPQFAGMMSRGPGSSSATSNTPASAQGSVGALNGARDEQQEQNRQRPPPPVPWKPPTTLLRLQSGQEVVISFEGTSQYTQGGLSACGLAAMNAARLVLEQRNRNGVDLIEMLSSRDFLQSVMAITSMWSDQDHLEIEDIRGLPLFQSSLRHVGESNAQTSFETFGRLLATLRENSRRSSNPPSPSAVVITKPPEIVAIIYIPMPQNVRLDGVFAVFDSHPRSAKGTKGASFILFPSLEGTCDYLARSLFYMDPDILTGDIGELMVAQLTQYSGNFFLALGDEAQIDGLLPDARSNYQANLELFRMRRELAELQSSNRSLVSERDRLKERAAQVEDLQAELRKHDLNLKEFEVANRRTNARLTTVQQENGLLNKERKELQTLLQDVAFQPPDAKSLSRARSPNSPRGPRPDRRIVNDNEDDVTERDLQIREAQEMIMQLLKEKTQLESRITWTNNIAKETQARLEAERDEARSQARSLQNATPTSMNTTSGLPALSPPTNSLGFVSNPYPSPISLTASPPLTIRHDTTPAYYDSDEVQRIVSTHELARVQSEEKLTALEKKVRDLEQELGRAQTRLESQRQVSEELIRKLTSEKDDLQREILIAQSDLEREKELSDEHHAQSTADIKDLMTENAKLRFESVKEREEHSRVLERMKDDLQDLEMTSAAKAREHEDKIRRLTSEKEEIQAELFRLRALSEANAAAVSTRPPLGPPEILKEAEEENEVRDFLDFGDATADFRPAAEEDEPITLEFISRQLAPPKPDRAPPPPPPDHSSDHATPEPPAPFLPPLAIHASSPYESDGFMTPEAAVHPEPIMVDIPTFPEPAISRSVPPPPPNRLPPSPPIPTSSPTRPPPNASDHTLSSFSGPSVAPMPEDLPGACRDGSISNVESVGTSQVMDLEEGSHESLLSPESMKANADVVMVSPESASVRPPLPTRRRPDIPESPLPPIPPPVPPRARSENVQQPVAGPSSRPYVAEEPSVNYTLPMRDNGNQGFPEPAVEYPVQNQYPPSPGASYDFDQSASAGPPSRPTVADEPSVNYTLPMREAVNRSYEDPFGRTDDMVLVTHATDERVNYTLPLREREREMIAPEAGPASRDSRQQPAVQAQQTQHSVPPRSPPRRREERHMHMPVPPSGEPPAYAVESTWEDRSARSASPISPASASGSGTGTGAGGSSAEAPRPFTGDRKSSFWKRPFRLGRKPSTASVNSEASSSRDRDERRNSLIGLRAPPVHPSSSGSGEDQSRIPQAPSLGRKRTVRELGSVLESRGVRRERPVSTGEWEVLPSEPPLRSPVRQTGPRSAEDLERERKMQKEEEDRATQAYIQKILDEEERDYQSRQVAMEMHGMGVVEAENQARARRIQESELRVIQEREEAEQLQRELDQQRRDQEAEFKRIVEENRQEMFECSICMDEHLVDDVALVEKCGHKFCRECMTDYIGSKLTENRFPILCPVCQAESDVQDAGFIQRGLVDQLALSQAQYDSWIDLELSQYSVMLDCRKCQSSGFVDSEDYKELQYIYCPLGDCDHVWCKACGQTVGPDQESQKLHSCDGENELNALMEAEGWKNCPGCKTPIERIIGCNHMACGTPGCNMHFCYKCGDSIIRSVLKDEIKGAVNAHFHQTTGKCPLFFIPAEDEGTS